MDRLERWWRPGLLFIGDAAHAMSPVGGIGINLAVQDAVAAARILAPALRAGGPVPGRVPGRVLARVQSRRMLPTRLTQRAQVLVQDRVLGPILSAGALPPMPLALRLLRRWPVLRAIPARLIGVGLRPEHVRPKHVRSAHATPG